MAFKFFIVPLHDDGAAEHQLNAFLSNHRVLAVDRRWVDQGAASLWCFCVDYLDSASPTPRTAGTTRVSGNRQRVDYKELLSADDFLMFVRLRDWRKQAAQAEAVPVYTVFTNEQLAQMIQAKAMSKADLEKIAGVGDARVEKYGAAVLEQLQALRGAGTDAPSGQPI